MNILPILVDTEENLLASNVIIPDGMICKVRGGVVARIKIGNGYSTYSDLKPYPAISQGFSYTSDGKLSLDISKFPEISHEVAKLLVVRSKLNEPTTFYVDKSGSDVLSESIKGLDISTAFSSIQACLNYIREHFIADNHDITITIGPGEYDEILTIENISGLTANCLNIKGAGISQTFVMPSQDTINALSGNYIITQNSEHVVHFYELAIKLDSLSITKSLILLYCLYSSYTALHEVGFIFTNNTLSGSNITMIFSSYNCITWLHAGCTFLESGNNTSCYICLRAYIQSMIYLAGNITINGRFSYTLHCDMFSGFYRSGTSTITGTVTGKRYYAMYSCSIFTNSGGSAFFPGSSGGSVSTYSVYA